MRLVRFWIPERDSNWLCDKLIHVNEQQSTEKMIKLIQEIRVYIINLPIPWNEDKWLWEISNLCNSRQGLYKYTPVLIPIV